MPCEKWCVFSQARRAVTERVHVVHRTTCDIVMAAPGELAVFMIFDDKVPYL